MLLILLLFPSWFLYGCFTSSLLAAQLSHSAFLHCWRSWERNVSCACCCVCRGVALPSTDSHGADYWSISSHSSLCSPPSPFCDLRLGGRSAGWQISARSPSSCMFANSLACLLLSVSLSPPKKRVGERRGKASSFKRKKKESGCMGQTDHQAD